jgi:DNA-binding response OmpR family regulator
MNPRILVLEDDDQLLMSYREFLTDEGYQVDCAQEVEEAQALLAHFTYALVITDLRLSKVGFGGLDFLKYVRQLSSQIRIIVLTGYSWPEIEAEALTHQIDAFVRKPTQLAELLDTIEMLMGVPV